MQWVIGEVFRFKLTTEFTPTLRAFVLVIWQCKVCKPEMREINVKGKKSDYGSEFSNTHSAWKWNLWKVQHWRRSCHTCHTCISHHMRRLDDNKHEVLYSFSALEKILPTCLEEIEMSSSVLSNLFFYTTLLHSHILGPQFLGKSVGDPYCGIY